VVTVVHSNFYVKFSPCNRMIGSQYWSKNKKRICRICKKKKKTSCIF